MDVDWLRECCLSHRGAYEDFPFGPDSAVYRVRSAVPGEGATAGKIFAFVGLDVDPLSISLKCDPALAVQLRAAHPEITGAWHLNKRHWNGVRLNGQLPETTIRDLIEDSYDLVVASLPKVERDSLGWSPGTTT